MSQYSIETNEPRVLSIQSTVVYGYVGNKSSVYGLHARQIEVDPLMTCQFSNHTGYDTWKGLKVDGSQLTSTVAGLSSNKLLPRYTHVLSGYMADKSFIDALPAVITEMKQSRKDYCQNESIIGEDSRVVFLCDPVLADDGELYVAESFIQVYKDKLIPLADIVTPNETELRLLCGIDKVNSIKDIQQGCVDLHKTGPSLIIVTSMKDYLNKPSAVNEPLKPIPHGSSLPCQQEGTKLKSDFTLQALEHTDEYYTRKSIGYPTVYPPSLPQHTKESDKYTFDTPKCILDAVRSGMTPIDNIGCMISYHDKQTDTISQYFITLPFYNSPISGTGDLIASLILAHLQQIAKDDANSSTNVTNHEELFPNTAILETNESQVVEAICRAQSTVHVVARASIIRQFVGKHCTTCKDCLGLQKLNKNHPQFVATHQQQQQAKTTGGLQQAPIVANLATEPLELWLTGMQQEFTTPTCTVTPIKLPPPL